MGIKLAWTLVAALGIPACGGGVCTSNCSPTGGQTTIESHFDSGIEGWSIEGYVTDSPGWSLANPPTHAAEFDASGGVNGGALYRDDELIGDTEYFIAPSSFLGVRDAFYGGVLHFAIRQDDTMNPFYGPLVMLDGPTGTLIYDDTMNPGLSFTQFEVPLTAAGWKHYPGGAVATERDLSGTLSDLRALRIRGEFSNSIDKSWVDDVVLRGP